MFFFYALALKIRAKILNTSSVLILKNVKYTQIYLEYNRIVFAYLVYIL